ncbi:vacuolar cation/proton exchanger 5-like [Gossypium australe]|uniref:Vacuolar cation/proton exchanger 5-like n=1 Tax=Gossypium australe TaxID=47621 RepID=A0A5B6V8L6_9ROSI|nr:vacuolar cation/proton exchanger 5-like [Gossypium australe]
MRNRSFMLDRNLENSRAYTTKWYLRSLPTWKASEVTIPSEQSLVSSRKDTVDTLFCSLTTTAEVFWKLKVQVGNQTDRKLKKIRSNNETEYTFERFQNYCEEARIITSSPIFTFHSRIECAKERIG